MITIDEAIKRQEEIIRTGTLGNTLTAYKAMLLGIEALGTIRMLREHHNWYPDDLLLGETKAVDQLLANIGYGSSEALKRQRG